MSSITLIEYRAVRLVDRHWKLITGREALIWKRRLRKAERKRRRRQARGVRVQGQRVDPHGSHRHIVKITTVVPLTDWIDDRKPEVP